MSIATPLADVPPRGVRPFRPAPPPDGSLIMTEEEYHAFLRTVEDRYEYHDDRAVPVHRKAHPMAGASPEHNIICKNCIVEVDVALEAQGSDCDVFGSDQKVFIRRGKVYLPDVAVACGGQFDENDCLRNPELIVEVLSDSTGDFDQNEKFREYRGLPSLRHYVLAWQDAPRALHFARTDAGWMIAGDYISLNDTLTLDLDGAAITVPLSRIYRRIPFGPEVTDESDDETV